MINGFTWDLPESIQAKHMFMHYSCCKYMKPSPKISLEWSKTFLFQQWSWNENLYIIDECSHAPALPEKMVMLISSSRKWWQRLSSDLNSS